jgi:hypothetical protein
MALTVFALAGGTAFCFSLILKMAAICLGWQDLPPLRELILKGGFIEKTAPLWDYYYPDILLLAAFFVLPPLMAGFALFRRSIAPRLKIAEGKPYP